MAIVAQNLVKGSTLTSESSAVYTAGVGTTVVSSAVVANPTSAAVLMTISIQRAGAPPLAILPGRAVAAGGTDLLPELGRVLASGDAILASGAGLVLIIDGYTLS